MSKMLRTNFFLNSSFVWCFFVLAFFFLPLFHANATTTAMTFKIMTKSDAGDYIGQNQSWDFSTPNSSTIKVNQASDNSVDFYVNNFVISNMNFQFGSAAGTTLTPGLHAPAKRFPFRDSFNGINISGDGRGCNTILGAYFVHEYAVSNGVLEKAAIDFVQICEPQSTNLNTAQPRLLGSLRYNSTVADSCDLQGCVNVEKNLGLVSLGEFISFGDANLVYMVGKNASNDLSRLVVPSTDPVYSDAIMDSNLLSTTSFRLLPQSLVESLPISKNLTIKSGAYYLVNKFTTTDYYLVDHENYLKKVKKADYPSYIPVTIPDAYWTNYVVMPEEKADLIITDVSSIKGLNSNGPTAIELVIKVKNIGTANLVNQKFYVSYNDNKYGKASASWIGSLNVNEEKTIFSPYGSDSWGLSYPASLSETLQYVFTVNSDVITNILPIAELNTVNNTFNKAIFIGKEIIVPVKPDLTIKDIQIKEDGGKKYLNVKINNAGVITGNGQVVGVKIIDLETGETYSSGYSSSFLGDVDTITSQPLNLKSSNVYRLRAEVDYAKIIDESNETNNLFEKKLQLNSSDASSSTLLLVKLDRVALNNTEANAGFVVSNLDYMNSDPEVTNSSASKPLEYIQQTLQSTNYYADMQYYTTGLRTYSTSEAAKYLFDYHNNNHTRTVINLLPGEKFTDNVFCHYIKPGANGVINNNSQGALLYYYICGFQYRNVYVMTQASLIGDDYTRALMLLKKYYYNLTNYNPNRLPPVPVVAVEEVKQIVNKDEQLNRINSQAKSLNDGKIAELISEIKQLRNELREQAAELKYLKMFTQEMKGLTANMQNAIKAFITYGVDDNTKKLGEGERAAVVSSYEAAFNKLPQTEAELADAIKIANGRFPTASSSVAEQLAKEQFYKIYKRVADMTNANDVAAIKVMAYGLRQKATNRNMTSESVAIKTFRGIFGSTPKNTNDWNTMQAITYSGASRKLDSDKDGLADETEKKLGTNPFKADTDGDGNTDGLEVLNGYNPNGPGKL